MHPVRGTRANKVAPVAKLAFPLNAIVFQDIVDEYVKLCALLQRADGVKVCKNYLSKIHNTM